MQALTSVLRKFAMCLVVVGALSLVPLPATAYADSHDSSDDMEVCGPDSKRCMEVCGPDSKRCNAFIEDYINPFIILLSGIVGVLAVVSIIVAGIQYSSSADDPAAVTKAKHRVFNTVVGLVAYIFLFAFLSYLVPGGVL